MPEKKNTSENTHAIHQYYMDIINCMPNVVYWVNADCELQGANNHFVELLNLHDLKNFKGTPYQLLEKHAHWPKKRVEAFKLDDMSVLFSGVAKHDTKEAPVEIISKFHPSAHFPILYYESTRVPLLDQKKQVKGLVVILKDVTEERTNIKAGIFKNAVDLTVVEYPRDRAPRVLMVEDNLVALKVEQALLIALGCQVDTAETGQMAEKKFKPGKYDVVFMDIGLQDTSGYIVAKKLREKEKGTEHHVPIIALTSYQADIVKYDCRDYFMDGVITKPLTDEQAQQIIARYVFHQDTQIDGLKSE